MDTKKDSSAYEVPTFKVARVGQGRKRKGGGFSFLRGGGSRGAWSGATGGSGAGAGAGTLASIGVSASKLMIILVASVAGLGAVGLGTMLGKTGNDVKKPKVFSMASKDPIQLEGDVSNLPSTANTIPNSLGYLTGSRDGLTPEERAKKEAEAAAAAEAQRLADEEAARKEKEQADKLAGNPAVDPNALLASAQADGGKGGRGSAFGKKFGSLSSSMGGGSSLSGGAGLSGGVNRQFGTGGSLGKGTGGQMAAMKGTSRPTYSKVGNSKLASNKQKGFARRQLANANALSRRGAAASKGETAAYDAASAFDNNQGAGSVIGGPGIGNGTKPSSGADSSVNPGSGGPTGGGDMPSTNFGPNADANEDGGCTPRTSSTKVKDANPMLGILANIATALLTLIGILSAIALIGNAGITKAITAFLDAVILWAALIICALGLMLIAMGDYYSGSLFTLIGGVGAAFAYSDSGILSPGVMIIPAFAGALLGQAGKMLDSKNHKAPAAAQQ